MRTSVPWLLMIQQGRPFLSMPNSKNLATPNDLAATEKLI
jgi:hypothetical protein